MTPALIQRAPTALIQLLRTQYISLTRQLPADARALLVWLLLEAHHVRQPQGPPVLRLSASGLAAELGIPRRRLTRLLAALEAAGAVAWRPGSGGRDGRLEVIAYPQLVRDGRREMGDGFVQLLVEPLEAERRRLGFDAWAVLVGLLIAVPWVGQRLQASGGHMGELLGVSWGVLRRYGRELTAQGLIRWTAGTRSRSETVVELVTYRRLVKIVVAEPGCERKAREVLVDRAEPASETRAGPGLLPPLDEKRLTETLSLRPSTLEVGEPPTPAPAEPEAAPPSAPTSQGKAGAEQQPDQPTEPERQLKAGVGLASALQSQGVAHDLLERRNRLGLRALSRRLSELAGNGWEPDALRAELLDGLRGVRSVLAVLLTRARALPSNPAAERSAADEQAEAMAREQLERRLEAARAHTRNLLAIDGIEPDDVLGGLWRYRDDVEAHRAAVDELVRLRPEASALLGGWSVAS